MPPCKVPQPGSTWVDRALFFFFSPSGDRDPVVRVRQQALSALVALLQAPQLKAWPVPLETSQRLGWSWLNINDPKETKWDTSVMPVPDACGE